MHDERNPGGVAAATDAAASSGRRRFRRPPPLHGRESHIRIFDPDNEARRVYGETQVSRDGSLPQEESGPRAVLKALDPFWTRGIIPGDEADGGKDGTSEA